MPPKPPKETAKPSAQPASKPQHADDEDEEEYEYEEVEVDEEELEEVTTPRRSKQMTAADAQKNENNNNKNQLSPDLDKKQQRKKKNFNESDSDLWSEIEDEGYRHPNHRWPPLIREISPTQDEFKITINMFRPCGISCSGFLAYFEFLCGLSSIAVGVLCFVLWREDLGFFSGTLYEGLLWTALIFMFCFILGIALIGHSLGLQETVLKFDRQTQRIRARRSHVLFSSCFSSRSDREVLDIHVNDVKRISVEGYSDTFMYRMRTGKRSPFDPLVPVLLVMRFDPDKNAVALDGTKFSSFENDEINSLNSRQDASGMTNNNFIVLARHPYYQAANRISYWQNYFVEGMNANRQQVMSWRKHWVQDVGHVDAEQVDLRISRFWRKKRLLKSVVEKKQQQQSKTTSASNVESGAEEKKSEKKGDLGKKNNNKVESTIRYGDEVKAENDEDEEVEEVEEVEEEQEETEKQQQQDDQKQTKEDDGVKKKQNQSSNNNKSKKSLPEKTSASSGTIAKPQRPASTESSKPLDENDKRPVETLKRKADKKAAAISKEDQLKMDQQHRAKLQFLLSRASSNAAATETLKNSKDDKSKVSPKQKQATTTKIPINMLLLEEGEGDTSNNNNTNTNTLLLTPRTIDAFSKLETRQNMNSLISENVLFNSVSNQSKQYFAQIREYRGNLSYLRSPIAKFLMVAPPLLVLILAILATVLQAFDVVSTEDYGLIWIAVAFAAAFGSVLLIELFVYFKFYAMNDVRIRMDFRKQKLYYETGYNLIARGDMSSSQNENEEETREDNDVMSGSDSTGGNVIKMDFLDIVKVTIGEHPIFCCFTSGEKSCVMLHFKDRSKEAKKEHVWSVLKVVPLCVLPPRSRRDDEVVAKPYLRGWEEFMQHAMNSLEQSHDQWLAQIGGVDTLARGNDNEMLSSRAARTGAAVPPPPPYLRRAASPAPLPSPSPDRSASSAKQKEDDGSKKGVTSGQNQNEDADRIVVVFHTPQDESDQNNTRHSPSPGAQSSPSASPQRQQFQSSNQRANTMEYHSPRDSVYRSNHRESRFATDTVNNSTNNNNLLQRYHVHHVRHVVERTTSNPRIRE